MQSDDLLIDSSTRVAALLDRYPELEDVLIGLAPAFSKLKNPILRRSVGKVATLRQAAAVAGVPPSDLVNTLRAAVGQPEVSDFDDQGDRESYFAPCPNWFDRNRIVASVDDTAEHENETTMPLVKVYENARDLRDAEIVELITTHLPAPGIDIMKKRGFLAWSEQEGPELIRTYFRRP